AVYPTLGVGDVGILFGKACIGGVAVAQQGYEAQHCQGETLGVLHEEEALIWETVERVECAGLRTVYKISVSNISYAAGVDSRYRIITHNGV
ncbi:hypothetical protein, partial [Microbulbifer sp. 2205BS26-8]|uniref:hypothetical protein n=1 Tax=Microbulbifer sp. 2205BS26-8 TaxID=3064386 RepID=UPI0035309EFE